MRLDFWFGLALTIGGVAIMAWSIWGGPWVTKFVWEENGGERVEYFSGDVSHERLIKMGLYEATHLALKSRIVMRLPKS